jgi:hypothetical protein
MHQGMTAHAFLATALITGSGLPIAEAQETGKDGRPWFVDATDAAGIDFRHVRNREIALWLPEIMSGGAAWIDADGDGWLDLYLVQGGTVPAAPADLARSPGQGGPGGKPATDAREAGSTPAQTTTSASTVGAGLGNVLLRNVAGQRFEDISESSGTGDTGYGMGAAVADYDADGDMDLYVTNLGPNVLYRNDGNGQFTDVTAAMGVGDTGWGTSAAWLDYDGDGDADLFVTNYVNWAASREMQCYTGGARQDYCHPRHYNAPAADVLYRNDGSHFTDVTETAGLLKAFGHGLGVAVADYDRDGHMDIYVANDGMPNQLWRNTGEASFQDIGLLSGTAVNMAGKAEAGMGVAAVDIDDDGDLDLFMSHLRGETNTLYINEGRFFRDGTPSAGLAGPSVAYTGFGLGFADFDHDGIVDLYVANGRVGQSLPAIVGGKPFAEPNLLFRGQGGGRYALVQPMGGTAEPDVENSRAAAFADYDRDGDVDVLVVNNGGPARLLRNEAADGHWIVLRILDGSVDATGAMVAVTDAGGDTRWRLVQPAYSYQASNDPHVHVGLGSSSALTSIRVRWVDGEVEEFGARSVDSAYTLTRGAGTVVNVSVNKSQGSSP